ncbi:hypothetical protein [Singulisphaera sp. PoT]|uniref:hypothetical protein n=1 Tax=Singulisphaera sp. PoT TaxID=3411797 RepID=UPI003BF4F922
MDTPQQDGATWCFSPPKRSNGKVLLGFCRKGEKGSDLDAFLEIVKALGGRGRLGAVQPLRLPL